MKKANTIDSSYLTQMSNIDFSDIIDDTRDILVIHGAKDNTVPLQSISVYFDNIQIIP